MAAAEVKRGGLYSGAARRPKESVLQREAIGKK